ncbi:MAG: hypothetical protein ABIC40_07580, partial [bacterium]
VDSIPKLLSFDDQIGAPKLSNMGGWHVLKSYDYGFGAISSAPMMEMSDRIISAEKELIPFFGTIPLPRFHIAFDNDSKYQNKVTSTNGKLIGNGFKTIISKATELKCRMKTEPNQWLALVINRTIRGNIEIKINGRPTEDLQKLGKDIFGIGVSQWEIYLVPPEYINSAECTLELKTPPTDYYDIFFVQEIQGQVLY